MARGKHSEHGKRISSEEYHAHEGSSDYVRVRKRRHGRRRKHAKAGTGKTILRVVLVVVLVVVVVFAACGVACGVQAMGLKSDASKAMKELQAVQDNITAGDYDAAATSAARLQATAEGMNGTLNQPQWALAAALPYIGHDVQAVQALGSALEVCSGSVLGPLVDALQTTPMDTLVQDKTVNIAAANSLLTALNEAAPSLQSATDRLDGIGEMNIEQLDSMVSPAITKFKTLNNAVQTAAAFSSVATSFLAEGGTHTYLVVGLNTAEMRAGDGFAGSVGTLTISNGSFDLGDFTVAHDVFDREFPEGMGHTEQEVALFGENYGLYTWDASYNPDLTQAAQLWAQVYENKMGTHIDGAIMLTPSMVQAVLEVAGSVTLSDGTELDGSNATRVLQHDLYWDYFSTNGSKHGLVEDGEYNDTVDGLFAEAAHAAFDKLIEQLGAKTFVKFCGAMAEGFSTREATLWFSDATMQAQIESVNCSGSLATTEEEPELAVFFNNFTGNKLGWWLDVETEIGTGVKNSDGSYSYTVTSTFTNTATAEIVAEADSRYIMSYNKDGHSSSAIYLFAPAGGEITGVSTSSYSFTEEEYEGRQLIFIGGMDLAPEDSVTVSYTVTTSAAAQSELKLVTNPTLMAYHESE